MVLVGDKKKKRQEGGIVHGKTIRPVIVRFERCIERLYRRTLFQKRLSESQSGKKRDRVEYAVKRKYDSFDNFPNVERFLAHTERERIQQNDLAYQDEFFFAQLKEIFFKQIIRDNSSTNERRTNFGKPNSAIIPRWIIKEIRGRMEERALPRERR